MKPNYAGGPLGIEERSLFPWVGALGSPRVGRAEGKELPLGRSEDYSSLLENDLVDGGEERFALGVVLELVTAAFDGAAESASANLGLGTPCRDPCVTPCSEHTGGHGGGGGFGDVDGFLELVVQDGLADVGFVGVGKESADSWANCVGKVVGKQNVFEPFRDGCLGRSSVFGGAFEYRASGGVGN